MIRISPKARWTAVVVGLLGSSLLWCATAIVVSSSDPSFAVEPNYEWKADHFDSIAAARAHAAALGFHLTADLSARAPGRTDVDFVVTDAAGHPLDDARLDVVAFHNARAGDRYPLAVRTTGSGAFRATLDSDRRGIWQFEYTIHSREGDAEGATRAFLTPAAR